VGTPTGHTFAQVSDREQAISQFRGLRAAPVPFDKMSINGAKGISVLSAPFYGSDFPASGSHPETIEPSPDQQLTASNAFSAPAFRGLRWNQ
jgi:hypothetical protein